MENTEKSVATVAVEQPVAIETAETVANEIMAAISEKQVSQDSADQVEEGIAAKAAETNDAAAEPVKQAVTEDAKEEVTATRPSLFNKFRFKKTDSPAENAEDKPGPPVAAKNVSLFAGFAQKFKKADQKKEETVADSSNNTEETAEASSSEGVAVEDETITPVVPVVPTRKGRYSIQALFFKKNALAVAGDDTTTDAVAEQADVTAAESSDSPAEVPVPEKESKGASVFGTIGRSLSNTLFRKSSAKPIAPSGSETEKEISATPQGESEEAAPVSSEGVATADAQADETAVEEAVENHEKDAKRVAGLSSLSIAKFFIKKQSAPVEKDIAEAQTTETTDEVPAPVEKDGVVVTEEGESETNAKAGKKSRFSMMNLFKKSSAAPVSEKAVEDAVEANAQVVEPVAETIKKDISAEKDIVPESPEKVIVEEKKAETVVPDVTETKVEVEINNEAEAVVKEEKAENLIAPQA